MNWTIPSHKSAAARTTDQFKDKPLAAAGLLIARIPAQRAYKLDELREKIAAVLAPNR